MTRYYRLSAQLMRVAYAEDLSSMLRSSAEAGLSLRQISDRLKLYGIEVTHQTISTWLRYPDS